MEDTVDLVAQHLALGARYRGLSVRATSAWTLTITWLSGLWKAGSGMRLIRACVFPLAGYECSERAGPICKWPGHGQFQPRSETLKTGGKGRSTEIRATRMWTRVKVTSVRRLGQRSGNPRQLDTGCLFLLSMLSQ